MKDIIPWVAPWVALACAFIAGAWVRDVWVVRKPAYDLDRRPLSTVDRRRAY